MMEHDDPGACDFSSDATYPAPEPLQVPQPAPAPGKSPRRFTPWLAPLFLLLTGMGVILALAVREAYLLTKAPWGDAVVVAAEEAPWPGMVEGRHKRVEQPLPAFAMAWPDNAEARLLIEGLALDKREHVYGFPFDEVGMAELLVSGRMPEPGQREMLAGSLAEDGPVTIDGIELSVVGRIDARQQGLAFAYFVGREDMAAVFADNQKSDRVWFDAAGIERLAVMEERQLAKLDLVSGNPRTHRASALAAVPGLMLVALGGSILVVRLLRVLNDSGRTAALLCPLFAETDRAPRIFLGLHVALYSIFFAMIFVSIAQPSIGLRVGNLVQTMFEKGDLQYVGDAYASENVTLAALLTFHHNFVVATFLTTLLPSLVIPFSGLIVNLVRFGLVGMALAPSNIDTLTVFTYHSVTMAVELEAYILASFAVFMYPVRLAQGAIRLSRKELSHAFALMASATVAAALVLAVAAVYEAATLILINRLLAS